MTKLVSLDIETSGTDPSRHQTLSLGLVKLDDLSERYYTFHWDEVVAVPESFRVNDLDITKLDQGIAIKDVKTDITKWFAGQRYTPLGMNVGAFDLKFVEKDLGQGFCIAHFGRRTLDLNALMFAITDKYNLDFRVLKEESYRKADALLKKQKPHLKPHHALYDAWRSVHVYKLLVQKV